MYTFLYRDKSGGGKAVPQQYSGNHVLRNTTDFVLSTLYSTLVSGKDKSERTGLRRVSVCVCVFIKLHITAQSGLVILVILCHSH